VGGRTKSGGDGRFRIGSIEEREFTLHVEPGDTGFGLPAPLSVRGGATEGAVLRAMTNREFGLGAADWGYEEVWRDWYDTDERIIVEIRERSWLRSSPDDAMDQRTCVVLRFRDARICELRDYTDAAVYEAFLARHRAELPKFSSR